ncbi:MAG: hypothetical protein AAF728_11990 [Cyanobacteria bacterium P01_D01_bin.128]
MDCKKLIYHPTRQEAITPIGSRLIKWDLTDIPRIVDTFPLSFDAGKIPAAALIEGRDAIAIAPENTHNSQTLELRRWEDGELICAIPLDHQAYDEDLSIDDEFCTHERCCALSALAASRDGRYLAALEPWSDLHLIDLTGDLQAPRIMRWRRRWPDYADAIAFDPQFQFLIWNWVDQDERFEFFRIDDAAADRLAYLGHFDGGARCHRGTLAFSPFTDALVHTDYFSQSRITYRRFDRANLMARNSLSETDSRELWDTPPATVCWHRELPLIQHPHDALNLWQTSVAFIDKQKLLWAAGEALVLLHAEDGAIAADYHAKTVIREVAFDRDRRRIIAATVDGVIVVSLSQFDPKTTKSTR